ncbi:hypothetical protein [Streptomyces sp. NBC_01443]|uniref:hypothetical protein n=1 Tax=Streptomyces sp. NBC_01443 TaxID=2903868 RepID=UPI00224EFB6A|nr:hypothetical protein [Streptomyces sp. NBC_01443]MCX4633046.1 hypothetical protein [Streptomyces sp. NBC_01443]
MRVNVAQIETGEWVNGTTGEQVHGPFSEYAEPVLDYPWLWKTTAVWVWNPATRLVEKYPAGTLL